MSLAAALAANKSSLKGPRCTICTLMDTLTKDDAAALRTAMADVTFTGAGISRALKAEGHTISGASVMRHRKGECSK
ncbi:hypothetical protein UFOVP199_21 [uncultured Caudovirales phage]|uniref:Uncharacterized protein n=1 Tax=uncultured Caudovirales phage TaxID=2100421 RepID=A0A6J7WL69_9CAUD|nr:hypothetical protein UFOVP199_21 [uncultured Caudovirales phage]